ncbi:major facilitator superfamily domain-containing protein [Podospora fimiseda]|uniref:Major facilitator superfamily domain-containing protein n=1 Tax=Podospora fimiseda TaxID=252190 RepID=A0AAN7BU45_9PEZI|nr:major facilitator superfamily domain-containing protein [Podospora fimiseda]
MNPLNGGDTDSTRFDSGGSTTDVADTSFKPPLRNSEDDQYPSGLKTVLLSSAALVCIFLIALDQTIIGTAIPRITDQFKSLSDISWYAAAYFMTYGATQPSAGKLYKYYDIKWTFLISMLIFEIGSLICGVAQDSKTLIVGRAIAGMGAGCLTVGSYSIVQLTIRPARRPMMMGVFGMLYAVAGAIGPLLGGAFTEGVSWRWCFYINLPIGGAAAVAVFFFFHLPAAAAPPKVSWSQKVLHSDPGAFVLIMGAITCFVLATQYAGATHAWDSSEVIGLLVGSAAIPAALIAWEMWLGDYASMPPSLYKKRSLWSASAYQFFFCGAYILLLYYLPIYFQSIKNTSPIQSGVNNLPMVLAASIFTLVSGVVVMKTGYAMPVLVSGSAITTVALGLIYTFDIDTPSSKWIGYQILVGVFMAFGIPHGLTVAQAGAGPEDIPAITGNLLFYQTVGGAFSTSAGQAAFVNQLLKELPKTASSVDPHLVLGTGASELRNVFSSEVLPGVVEAYMVGIKGAFAVALAFAGVAFLFSLMVPAKRLETHTNPEDAPMMMGG